MNGTSRRTVVLPALAALTVAMPGARPAVAQTPSITLVGYPAGADASRIYGLSADGRTAAGVSLFPTTAAGSPWPGFVWHAGSGRADFGQETGVPRRTIALSLSGDGSTVVGWSSAAQDTAPQTAFRWSGTGTFQSLGSLGTYPYSHATGANNDGSVVVGSAYSAGSSQAFRWTQGGGMQALGPADSEANAISRDGSTIVGETRLTSGAPQTYRWTQAGGVQPLPALPGTYYSYARGVSADGRDIVGISSSTTAQYPTRWHDGQAQNLGLPVGWHWADPLAVSDDGQVVVGTYDGAQTYGAAIWTPSTGFMPLMDYLAGFGITLPDGVWLDRCMGVSADGRTFAGVTFGPAAVVEGFVATVPAPGSIFRLLFGGCLAARRKRR